MSFCVDLAGSERRHPRNAVRFAQPAFDEKIPLTLILRRKQAAPHENASDRPILRTELAQLHGANADDVQAVLAFASENELSVRRIHLEARTIILESTLGKFAKLFGADVQQSQVN